MKYLVFLSLLMIGAHCKLQVYRGKNGTMGARKSGSFAIIIPAGKKIAFRIEQLRLKPRGSVMITNQQTGRRIQFRMEGSTLYKINGTEKSAVSFPASIELQAKKLRVGVKKARRFLAKYEVFVDGRDTCRKDNLRKNLRLVSCDSGDVSPVAETCVVAVRCPQNYRQERDSMTCRQGFWYGDPECVPDMDIVNEQCQVDSQSTRVPLSCPYPVEELARYLATRNPEFETLQDDRNSGTTVDCRRTCKRSGSRWLVNCGSPRNRGVYMKCLVCRVYAKCNKQTVIFA